MNDMSAQICNPHPIESDGVSQRQRALAALAPAANPIDGRDLTDLLGYAERYAAMLQYWSDTQVRSGDWQSFIQRDVSALVARIAREDIAQLRRAFERQRGLVQSAPNATLAAEFSALYQLVAQIAQRLDGWYQQAPEKLSLHRALEGWIASSLGDAMRTLVAQAKRAHVVEPNLAELNVSAFHALWRLDGVLPDTSLFSNGSLGHAEDQTAALEQVGQAQGQIIMALEQLTASAPDLMQETLQNYPEHQPHMALLLSFLQLFGHAQEHLNRLTAEHLKFYYRDVLGLQPTAPVPDQAHLVLEPAKLLPENPVIARGTLFKGGKDASGAELLYAADEELVLNQARLDADEGLKSVYVATQNGVVDNIYAATDADSADGLGADLQNEDGQWQTFGSQSMPYAALGFAVASPMLQLNEGDRTIRLRFNLDEALAPPSGISADDLAKELRLNIIAQGSGAKGWVDLAIHAVEFGDKADPYLQFRLFLGATAPALTAYNPAVLDGGFATQHPLIRFVLDNEGLPAKDLQEEPVSIDEPTDPTCVSVPRSTPVALGEATQNIARSIAAKQSPVWLKRKFKALNFADKTPHFASGALVRFKGRLYRAIQEVQKSGYRPDSSPDYWTSQKIAYPYRYLHDLKIHGLRIEVKVRNLRNLILENDQGVLDPAKPFMPFGPIPKIGSAFLIGSDEVFNKPLDKVRLDIQWAGLPQENFSAHYAEYGITALKSNQYFTAQAGFLHNGQWHERDAEPLFDDAEEKDKQQSKDSDVSFTLIGAELKEPPPLAERCFAYPKSGAQSLPDFATESEPFTQYRAGMRQGFMRLRLDQHDFGHAVYPVRLTEEATKGSRGTIPNAPYVPLISELKLGYDAHQEINYQGLGADNYADRVEQLFQIWPFGRREIWPIATLENSGSVPVEQRLVPHFETGDGQATQGTLYVGLNGLDLTSGGKNLAVLVQLAEGSADPELPVQPVVWSYLVDDVWHDFKPGEILADGTHGLLRSGIIRFAMPKNMIDQHQTLPSGRHWIKASVARNTAAVCKLIALHTQALSVSLQDHNNDPNHLAAPLAAGAIAKLKERVAAVKKVAQPYASFAGRMAENDDDFYVRVSERLRHKGRAITLFDYERLVLQAFPEIYKVKCINHANRQTEHAPGHVRIIVVPDLRNRNAVDPLQPKASLDLLNRIQTYLDELTSDFIDIKVTNPDYEAIRVNFQVRLHTGYDQGYYLGQLISDIQRYLSPWLHDDAADISFGGRIHKSSALLFVEQLEYVDFVTDFRMDQHLADGSCQLDVEQAVTSHAGAVLVSAPAEEYSIGVDIQSCVDTPSGQSDGNTGPQEPEPMTPGPRYLGNVCSRELHDLNRVTTRCHVERIEADRQRRFYNVEDALALGYDFCAHCFGRDLSKR